jgi:acetyltransferase-like isoleucine patch superfamily enzyme
MVTTTNDNYVGRTAERFKHRKGVTVERGGRIGGAAVLLPGVVVGQEALVAAGSVVTRNVPAYQTVMGVPARVVRPVPEEQLLFPPAQRRPEND